MPLFIAFMGQPSSPWMWEIDIAYFSFRCTCSTVWSGIILQKYSAFGGFVDGSRGGVYLISCRNLIYSYTLWEYVTYAQFRINHPYPNSVLTQPLISKMSNL